MADKLGPRAHAGTVPEAVAYSSLILLAVPYSAPPLIARDNGAAPAGKIIIDASNPIARRDGAVVIVPLARAMDFAPGTALFGKAIPADELRERLGTTQ